MSAAATRLGSDFYSRAAGPGGALGGGCQLALRDVDGPAGCGVVVGRGRSRLDLVGRWRVATLVRPLGRRQRRAAFGRLPDLFAGLGVDDPLALRPLFAAV